MRQLPTSPAHRTLDRDTAVVTSLSLIARAKVDDKDAWRRLVTLYTPFLHYWCRRWGVGREDADDILQDVFQAIASGLKDFRRDRPGDSFRGWLRGIARNKTLTLLRRQGCRGPGGTDFYRRSLLIPDAGHDPIPDEDDPEEGRVVETLYQQALNLVRAEFEERTWRAFWRATIDGQAPTLIAQDLGVTPAAVRQAKSRVLRRFREVLGEPPRPPDASRPV